LTLKWRTSFLRVGLALLLACCLAPACPRPASAARGTEVRIGIRRGAPTRLSLRLDEWTTLGDLATAQPAAAQGRSIVKADLEISGLFTLNEGPAVLDSAAMANLLEQSELAVELRVRGTAYELHARLYGMPGRSLIADTTLRATEAGLRRAIHAVSDEVVYRLSGERGIACSQIAYAQQTGSGRELFVADYDGFGARQATRDRNLNFSPTFSPDGRTLAFTSLRGRGFAICLLDLATGRDRVLASFPGSALSPAFSPDGQELAFASSKDGNHEIYVVRLDGSGLRRLTHNPGIDVQPTWSPNGRQIAFCSDRAGAPQIYIMDVDGTNVHRLTNDQARNEAPAWSPRGGFLAFMTRLGNGYDVCAEDAGGGTVTNLTQGRGSNESPHWAANGRHLLMVSNRDGKQRLYILNSDNGEVFPLPIAGNVQTPAWYR
jgi:tol-pal system beta propeller repeat protein TolB